MKAKWTTAVMIAAFSGALAIGTGASAAPQTRGFDQGNTTGHYKTDEGTTRLDFNKLDQNNDGRISKEEAAADPTLTDHFKRLDNNSDGQIEKGEFARFEAMEHGKQMKQMKKQDKNVNPGQAKPW